MALRARGGKFALLTSSSPPHERLDMASLKSSMILFTHNGIGSTGPGDAELQTRVTGIFLTLLGSSDDLPGIIGFYTDGVRLACEGSPLIEPLRALEAKGVRLVVCKTCLDHFGLTDKVQVGIVGGMPDIIEAMSKADKVISV
jgi:hypothetical protein